MRAIKIPICVVVLFGCAEAAPVASNPEATAPSADTPPPTTGAPVASASAAPSAEKPAAPATCKLWDRNEESPAEERWLYRWTTIREKAVLTFEGATTRAQVEQTFPKGHRFQALTTQGPSWLTAEKFFETQMNTMNGPEKLQGMLLTGDAKRAGDVALILPALCVKGEPKLRPLKAEPFASVSAALKVAGKSLDLKLDAKTTVVARAALPNGAAFVVNQHVSPKMGYPDSVGFTMKADGTVVDVLLKGETPTHSLSFPYAVDLDGDGVDELVHIHDLWEDDDSVHLVGWLNGKPRSVFIDTAVEQRAPGDK